MYDTQEAEVCPAEMAQFALRMAITEAIEVMRADMRRSMQHGFRSNRQTADVYRDRLISMLNLELYHLGLCVRRRPHTTWSFPL